MESVKICVLIFQNISRATFCIQPQVTTKTLSIQNTCTLNKARKNDMHVITVFCKLSNDIIYFSVSKLMIFHVFIEITIQQYNSKMKEIVENIYTDYV